MTSKSALPGILAMLGATASFVTTDTLAKIAMSNLPPLQVLFLRNVSATLWCGAAILVLGLARQLGGMSNRYVLMRSAAERAASSPSSSALRKCRSRTSRPLSRSPR